MAFACLLKDFHEMLVRYLLGSVGVVDVALKRLETGILFDQRMHLGCDYQMLR